MDTKPYLRVYEIAEGDKPWHVSQLHVIRTMGHAVLTTTHGIYGDTENEQQQSRVNALDIAACELTGR